MGLMLTSKTQIVGRWNFQLIRENKIIQEIEFKNLVTVEGKNAILQAYFAGGSAPDPWYIGLVNNSPVPSFSEDDTLASHAGWSELTDYAGNRKEWVDAAASAKIKGTTTASEFTMNAAGTIGGGFLCSAATGTTGVLWSVGSFPTTVAFANADVFRASYSISL